MRFTFAESLCPVDHLLTLAREAEAHGYHGFSVPDSVCYPKESDSKYPYTPDGNREFLDGQPFIDPFCLVSALGAITTTLHFSTFVVKLPIRHPVLVAKQVTSVSCLTNDRFSFGVGLSPWPDDYRIMDQPWKGRGTRMNEMIEIIQGLSSGEYFEFHGKYYDLEPIKLCPVPSKPTPILIGGHSDAALRRAARLCNGWMHAGGGKAADLDGALDRLTELRREYGRENEPFEIHVISMDAFTPDGAKRLEDRGVTDVFLGVRDVYGGQHMSLDDKIATLRALADGVIAKVN